MSTTQWFQSITMQAAVDLTGSQNLIVDISSGTAKFECTLAKPGQGFGILHNHPASGQAATVIVEGFAMVRCGQAIGAGQLFTVAAIGSFGAGGAGGWAAPSSVDGSQFPFIDHTNGMLKILGTMLQTVASGQLGLAHLERFITINSAAFSSSSFGFA